MAGPQAWLAGSQAWLAGPQVWLAGPQAWLDGPEGGTNEQTDGQKNERTNGRKISPFYRISSPIWPKKRDRPRSVDTDRRTTDGLTTDGQKHLVVEVGICFVLQRYSLTLFSFYKDPVYKDIRLGFCQKLRTS